MATVICPCVECINNGKGYKCRAKNIRLKYRNMATVNEGRVDMWVCSEYELTEESKHIEEQMKRFLRQGESDGKISRR